ncbi:MAG: amino acid adenylation domain-containing protein [Candidatus Aminicenantes bacterium]|jgi:surfactin family lipopeptide synthetase A
MTGNRLPKDIEDIYPMSDIEKGLIFHSLKNPKTSEYHDQLLYALKQGDFEAGTFKKAFALMVEKHPILRTEFYTNDFEEPVQVVRKKVPLDVEHYNISKQGKAGQKEYLENFLARDRQKPFNIKMAPIWRLRTFSLDNENICILLVFHHAILDGWSVASLLTELYNTYRQLKSNPDYVPVKLKSTYKEFILEQMVEKRKSDVSDYWKKELEAYKRLDFLKALKEKNDVKLIKKDTYNLGNEMLLKLKQTAKQYHTTVKNLCFSAYLYMLYMFSFENDMVVGLVTNNRPLCEDGDKILGCFVNTVPFRIEIPTGIKWTDYLRMVDKKLLELKNNERISLFEILAITGKNTRDKNPIFDTLFNFIDFFVYHQVKEYDVRRSLDIELPVKSYTVTNTLLDFTVNTIFGGFSIVIHYTNSTLSDKEVKALFNYFASILNKFIDDAESPVKKDRIMSVTEKHQLLFEFNNTRVKYPGDKTIHELFEEQAVKNPDSTAVVGMVSGDLRCALTYRELNKKSNQLAFQLKAKGVNNDIIVGIMARRSIEMVIGLLGILKAGGAYFPVDPDDPGERIKYMLHDSQTKILLSQSPLKEKIDFSFSGDIIFLDSEFSYAKEIKNVNKVRDLAYIMYTSGSTGSMKAILVEHQNVTRLVKNTNYVELNHETRILQTGAPVFDATTFEIWGSLLNGGRLFLVSNQVILDANKLEDALVKNNITTLWLSSPLFNQLMQQNEKIFSGLRYLLVGGDVLSPMYINRTRNKNKELKVINGYGPTENTTFSACCLIDKAYEKNIPIGKPISNSTAYILDKHDQLQPIGVPGELCVGGDGVSRGYLNNPELTEKKFVRNPLLPGDSPAKPYETVYRTGDLARWLPDGNIQFLGRMDFQVKIRGFRVELGEIEIQLLKHVNIKEAIVIPKQDKNGDRYLCAYIVSKRELFMPELRQYLSKHIPGYMIPSYFISLETIPLTANGKVNRKALPEPEAKSRAVDYIAPGDSVEEKLVEIWSEVLGIEKGTIGIDSDFFELGGHSLKATMLLSKLHKAFDVKIALAELFTQPTIRELSTYIKGSAENIYAGYVPLERAEKKEYYALSSGQTRIYVQQMMDSESISYNIPTVVIVEGPLETDKLEDIVKRLIKRHESLGTSFVIMKDGPVQQIQKNVGFEIEYHDLYRTQVEVEEEGVPFGQISDAFGENLATEGTENTEKKPFDPKVQDLRAKSIINSFIRPFDLSRAPLLRVGIIHIPSLEHPSQEGCFEDMHILMADMHHIISDGMSMSIFLNEFMAYLQGKELPPLRIQYKDYSQWQNRLFQSHELKKQEKYWLKVFAGEIPAMNNLIDYPRPSNQDSQGDSISIKIDKQLTHQLQEMKKKTGTTLYMILLAVYNILLSKYTQQEDIVVGSGIAGRKHADLENIIGMFVNMLPMRNRPGENKTFNEFLEEVKKNTLEAFENQDYPFDQLVMKLGVQREYGRNPLFDTQFTLQNMEVQPLVIPGLILKYYNYRRRNRQFDVSLNGIENGQIIKLIFSYRSSLFKRATVEKLGKHYTEIMEQVVKNQHIHLKDIRMSQVLVTVHSKLSRKDVLGFEV